MGGPADSTPTPGRGLSEPAADLVWTVPNALSALRLAGVPVFLWLLLGPQWDWAALGVLMFSGISDYLDGKIARAWGQTSRIGQLLDPAADRLYIVATLIAFTVRGIIPLVLLGVLVGRELLLAGTLPVLRRHGYGPLPVHYLGKAATFNLLYAFPLLLVGVHGGLAGEVCRIVGWAFTIWGTCLYWFAGALYVVQVGRLVRADRPGHNPGATRVPRPDDPEGAAA